MTYVSVALFAWLPFLFWNALIVVAFTDSACSLYLFLSFWCSNCHNLAHDGPFKLAPTPYHCYPRPFWAALFSCKLALQAHLDSSCPKTWNQQLSKEPCEGLFQTWAPECGCAGWWWVQWCPWWATFSTELGVTFLLMSQNHVDIFHLTLTFLIIFYFFLKTFLFCLFDASLSCHLS